MALANAPHESLFSSELVIILVEHFWKRYYYAILYRIFLPWLVYFFLVIFYVTMFSVSGIEILETSERTTEVIMRLLIVVLMVYLFFFEIVCMLRDGLAYLKDDVFNWIDLISFGVNIYLIIATVWLHPDNGDRTHIRSIGSLAVTLMWFKAFYWLRMFTATSFYIRLIKDTLVDVRYFLILFVLILVTFANALLVLNENR